MWIERSVVKRQRPALALILIICRTCCSPARLRPSHPCPAAAASTAASTEQPINPRLAQSRRSAPHGSAADACRNLPRQGRLPARQLPRQPATSLARSPNGDSLALHFSLCVTVPRRRRPLLLPPRKLSANTANRVPSFDTTPRHRRLGGIACLRLHYSSLRRSSGVPWQVERIQMPYSHPRHWCFARSSSRNRRFRFASRPAS